MIPAHRSSDGPIPQQPFSVGDVHFAWILVGIDFSDSSARALQVPLAVGESFASKINLIHAVPNVYGPQTYPMRTEFLRANLDRAGERMNQLVTEQPRLRRLNATTTVAYGSPAELIQQIAVDESADLIVVGAHGTSGIERLVLGSVAESIVRKIARPVLVVGPHCAAGSAPYHSACYRS